MRSGRRLDITEEMLERAWSMKCRGLTNEEIADDLDMHLSTFDRRKKEFYRYFAKKRREERRGMHPVGRHGSAKLDKLRSSAISLAALGENFNQIALQLGIPESTLRSWMKTDETFGHEMHSAKDNADENVIRSLLRRATGFNIRQSAITKQLDGRGNVIAQTRHFTSRKFVADVHAIKLWLVNRRGWISESEGSNKNFDKQEVEYDVRKKLYDK